ILERLAPARWQRRRAGIAPGKAARQLHHKARVDAVLAGRDAIAAAAAHIGPADRLCIALAAGDQVDDGAGGLLGIGGAEPRRVDHRAGAEAVAAARAGLGDRRAARPERVEKPCGADRLTHAASTWLAAVLRSGPFPGS